MKVVILCGGVGARMREETEFRPKPMVEVGGRPMLWHIMKMYAHFGFYEFIICVGYKGNAIKEYFLNYDAMNSDFTVCLGQHRKVITHARTRENFVVTVADTGAETLTGGRLARIKDYVDGDHFLLTYGDGVSDVNLTELLKFHMKHGRIATVTSVPSRSRFGLMSLGRGGLVEEFAEKAETGGNVSAGFFAFNRRIFDYLGGDTCALERGPMEKLVAEKQLMAHCHRGFFYAMDTYRECQHLNDLWAKGLAPWKIWSD